MAKSTYKERIVIDLIGVLEENEDGSGYVCVVEDSNSRTEYDMNEVLKKMVGCEVSFKSSSTVED